VAKKPRKPRLDDKALPALLTTDVLRSEFIAECSLPENRIHIVGKKQTPLQCLRSTKSGWKDKLAAWEKVVNRLGLTEKQQIEMSGGLLLEDGTSSSGVPVQ